MSKSSTVLSNMIWRFSERICAQIVSFIVSVILARILMPSEYGVIAMTTTFITICNVFATSGFGMALIQKEITDDLDYSTILVFGFSFSLILYSMLFITTPAIARFYSKPVLTPVLRVMALKLPMAAVNSVQQAFVSRKMLFKKFFWSTLIGTVTSGIAGIIMAYYGFGVWALVAQYLINSLMDTIILGISLHWFPGIKFSITRLKSMIRFGWNILLSDLINTVYIEMRNLIIGKKYTSEQLAYYNKGQQIPHIFVTNVGVAISSVLFPAMSIEQSEKGNIRRIVNKAIGVGTYIMFPLMVGLALTARPIIILLLTEKWIFAVPFLQMACISFAFEPWSTANLQAIKATGASGRYLKQEIIKKTLAFILLFVSIPYGVYAIAASACVYSFIAIILTASMNKGNINYGFFEQLKDICPTLQCTIVMGIAVFFAGRLDVEPFLCLCIQIIVGVCSYYVSSKLIHNNNLQYVVALGKSFMNHQKSS